MKVVLGVIAALLLGSEAQAQAPLKADAQRMVDEMRQKMEQREPIISTRKQLMLQLTLPQHYTSCLHAAVMGMEDGNAQHSFLLRQADYMASAGASGASMQTLVGYGNGVATVMYFAQKGRGVDTMETADIKGMRDYAERDFSRLRCTATFDNPAVLDAMRPIFQRLSQ